MKMTKTRRTMTCTLDITAGKECTGDQRRDRVHMDEEDETISRMEGDAGEVAVATPESETAAGGVEVDKSNGWVEGYASTWDTDIVGERFVPGAWKKSIAEAVPAGNVRLMVRHMRDGGDVYETVGTIAEAKEDEKGLFIRAYFAPDADSQVAREKVVSGHVRKFSVGYIPLKWRDAKVLREDGTEMSVVEITEAKMLEVTLTSVPVNPESVITGAKSQEVTQPSKPAPVLADVNAETQVNTPAVSLPDVGLLRMRLRLAQL